MSASFQAHILNVLHKCKSALSIYLDFSIDQSLIELFRSALQRGIVVDLILSVHSTQKVEQNPFLLKNLFELKSKGLNIFRDHKSVSFEGEKCIIETDFKKTYLIKKDFQIEQINGTPFEYLFKEVSSKEESKFHTDQSDIKATFFANNTTVFRNGSTIINWDVENAEAVKINGIGEVETSSSMKVQILENTILILTATNKKQQFKRAIFLKAIENIQIDFDIQFLNPASKKFVSLKTDEDTEGVFGITKGQQVKLLWNVNHADQVKIDPFNFDQKKGEHIFRPNGSLEINIQASLQGKAVNQRIIIHEYPMPVFTEKLIDIDSDFVSKSEISIKNYREEAYEYVKQNHLLDNDKFTEDIKSKIDKQEKNLMGLYDKLNFSDFYEEHSVEKMNKSVVDRLKSYFSDQPHVIKMINLLQKNKNE